MQTKSLLHAPSPQTVIVVGPPQNGVGGMASVVGQMLALDFSGQYNIELLPITLDEAGEGSSPCQSGSNSCSTATRRTRSQDRLNAPPAHKWPGRSIVRHVRQLRLLRAAIRRTRASIVHIHTCSGFSFYRSALDMLVSERLGCRTILHIHGARFDEFHAGEQSWRRSLIAWSLSRADCVIALSQGWREKLQGMAPNARLVVIENAVDLPRVAPNSCGGRQAPVDEACRFLLLARMDEWKGVDDLLCACARLHAAGDAIELTLAGPPGTAGDTDGLGKKIAARNLESVVRYVGPVHGARKYDLLARADVYVQPSHHEGMPIALLEALACGLPVVATRVGAVPEVIDDRRHGLLVPPRRPDALAQAMRELANDVRLRRAMSHAARALAVERFSISRFRKDLILAYDGLFDR